MASYAALLSLFHTLNNINNHPLPPISLDQQQLHSLTQNLTFLLDFLERYSREEDDELDSRITAAAYAAEDVIESHIVDQIHAGSTSHGENCKSVVLHQGLERVIVDMDLIKKELMEVIIKPSQHHHLHTNPSVSTASATVGQSSATVELDDVFVNKVLDKLTGQECGLQIIPIVGMGGIGKTTFARYIYSNPLIVQHFDILAWVTISQEYSRGNILKLLCQQIGKSENGLNQMSEDEIGEKVYKSLWRRRYLIVMDDLWNIEAFEQVKQFLPNSDDRNRIMITTRLSYLAFELSGCHDFHMQFLDEDKSWDLLCKTVFGELDCPIELEDIGKEIARNCRGLPLSIAVIGGLLTKSNMTRIFWEYCSQHLNSLINLEGSEYCLQVLRTSYKELPIHLKPCFLYLGVFPEDSEIRVSNLIKLWVSEGILKPNDEKCLEDVAEEYLKELIQRNLVLVAELRWNGEAKICKIHDLLRDMCLREAKKQKFLCVVRQQQHHTPQGINMERRIFVDRENKEEEYSPEFLRALESASLTRSLFYRVGAYGKKCVLPIHFGLLRVYSPVYTSMVMDYDAFFEHANLRYLCLKLHSNVSRLTSLCSLLWNLQTIKLEDHWHFNPHMAPSEIWEMPLLRHVMLNRFELPDPPHGEHNFVLEHLQTLQLLRDLRFSEGVVKRIPNVKKLKVQYVVEIYGGKRPMIKFCLDNLDRLQKLESLYIDVVPRYRLRREDYVLNFPNSVKKLSLSGTMLRWKEVTEKIGSLPRLQFLRLYEDAGYGPMWKTVEGKFCSLRLLYISYSHLKYWDTDSTHFPRLENLTLRWLTGLEEIPSSIGDIPTLKSIHLDYCKKSAHDSAERIKKEQEENGNDDLQLIIDQDSYSDEVEVDVDWDEEYRQLVKNIELEG